MSTDDIRTCVTTAAELLTARSAGSEANWQAAWERVAHDAGKAQLTIYLLCCAIDDAPKRVDRTGAWNSPYITVSREIGRKPEGRAANELISAARLLNTCGIQGDWHVAWDEADDDVRHSLADAVLRTWRTAIPGDGAAMRAMLRSLRSIGTPGARRRIGLATGYYRRLPGNLWRMVHADAPATGRIKGELAFSSLRRSRTHDRPAIPAFDRLTPTRMASMISE